MDAIGELGSCTLISFSEGLVENVYNSEYLLSSGGHQQKGQKHSFIELLFANQNSLVKW